MKSPWCQIWGFYWWAVLGPSHISVGQRWSLGGNLSSEVCRKPLVYFYTGIQDSFPRIKLLKCLVLLLTCLPQKTVYVWNVCKSLTIASRYILYFCWCHRLLSCLLDSAQSQTPGRKEQSHYLSLKEPVSPWGLEEFPAEWRQEGGAGKPCLSSAFRRTSLGTSAEFSPLLPTPSPSLSTWKRLHCISHLSF